MDQRGLIDLDEKVNFPLYHLGEPGLDPLLLALVGFLLGSDDPRTFWLWVFLAVGVHFLPFGLVHGSRMTVLDAARVLNAAPGLLFVGVPFRSSG